MGARVPVLPAEEYARRQRRAGSPAPHLWSILDAVKDPEIPSVSIWELGILQNVTDEQGTVVVIITPTYSGCPAIQAITADIQSTLADAGFANSKVVSRLAPAWSTSWLTDDAREKLELAGIAAPAPGHDQSPAACPRCGSADVICISQFGSTSCKSLYQCRNCSEPFDYMKPF